MTRRLTWLWSSGSTGKGRTIRRNGINGQNDWLCYAARAAAAAPMLLLRASVVCGGGSRELAWVLDRRPMTCVQVSFSLKMRPSLYRSSISD